MLTAIVIFSLAPFHFNLNAAWPAPGMYKSQIVRALYMVELLLSQQTKPMDTAAIVINSVVCEGG